MLDEPISPPVSPTPLAAFDDGGPVLACTRNTDHFIVLGDHFLAGKQDIGDGVVSIGLRYLKGTVRVFLGLAIALLARAGYRRSL